MSKEWAEIKLLLKNKDNRVWYLKNWGVKLFSYFTAFVSVWTLLEAFNINFTNILESVLPGSGFVILVLSALICAIVSGYQSIMELKDYSKIRVETERSGCSVEIRVADSYLTNAFDNYPNSSMVIGINKAFWFQEAEPGSLVADMWERLEKKGIKKEDVQKSIDKALEALWTKDGIVDEELKASFIDKDRPKVYVKCKEQRENRQACNLNCNYDCKLKELLPNEVRTECRDNYNIGTVICVDLRWTEPEKMVLQKLKTLIPGAIESGIKRLDYNISSITNNVLRIQQPELPKAPLGVLTYIREKRYKKEKEKQMVKKLYLIANAEVVQGFDMSEPMKVTFDRDASVVESFSKIWEYFEKEKKMNPMPPNHVIYQPLLIPLIGAGVANEGYSDVEIFSKIVDLYYEHLRKSIRAGKHPVIPNLIINIQSKTAIESSGFEDGNSRTIDLKTAFWYLKYRNKVNPVASKNVEKLSQ